MKKTLSTIILLITLINTSFSQNLDSLMNTMTTEEPDYATATFKATRIINTHSVEQLKEKHLDFRIHHRFGKISQGSYEFFGLDQGTIFLGLEYGIKDWLTLGVGRSSSDKTFNGFTKLRLLRQSKGSKNMPISLSFYAGTDFYSIKRTDIVMKDIDRFSYIFQTLIARKFSESFSLQISPGVVHQNLVATALDNNDVWFIATGGRYKLSKRISFNAEYNYAIRPSYTGAPNINNNLSLGFDIETGGHVFQLMVTNSTGMIERKFINDPNTGAWSTGDIMLGFNVSRIFSFN